MTDMVGTPNGRPKRARNLAEQLVTIFSDRIRAGTLRPGDKLPTETEISLQEGVSRTVVREAISRLQASGLAQTHHGIGTFVLEPASALKFDIDPTTIVTIRDVMAMLELRITLETEAAGLAAARRSEEHLAEMRRALDLFEANIEDPGGTVKPDFDFHMQIANATDNRYFVDVWSRLGTATIPRTRVDLSASNRTAYLRTVHRQHEDIYQAILARDPESARMQMRLHLAASRERFRRAHDVAEAQTPLS
jgi:GntR family transcriptional regulator, transcriptional repressor for pyruvate dehydrogenase complex